MSAASPVDGFIGAVNCIRVTKAQAGLHWQCVPLQHLAGPVSSKQLTYFPLHLSPPLADISALLYAHIPDVSLGTQVCVSSREEFGHTDCGVKPHRLTWPDDTHLDRDKGEA